MSVGVEGSDPAPEVVATVGVGVLLLELAFVFDEHELRATALRAIAANSVKGLWLVMCTPW